MRHLVNILPGFDGQTTRAALATAAGVAIEDIEEIASGNTDVVIIDGPPELASALGSVEGVCNCADADAEVKLVGFVALQEGLQVNQMLGPNSWHLAALQQDEGPYEVFSYDFEGEGFTIIALDTLAAGTPDLGSRFEQIYNPFTDPPDNNHADLMLGIAAGLEYGVAKKARAWNSAGFSPAAVGTTSSVNAGWTAALDRVEADGLQGRFGISCSFTFAGFLAGNAFSANIARTIALGGVITAAAGNAGVQLTGGSGFGTHTWPADDSRVLTIGSHEQDFAKSDFSSYGVSLDGFIGGRSVAAMNAEGQLAVFSGTSPTAQTAMGILALYWSAGVEDPVQFFRDELRIAGVTNVPSGPASAVFLRPSLANVGEPPALPPPPEPEPIAGSTGKMVIDGMRAPVYILNGNLPPSPFNIINEGL